MQYIMHIEFFNLHLKCNYHIFIHSIVMWAKISLWLVHTITNPCSYLTVAFSGIGCESEFVFSSVCLLSYYAKSRDGKLLCTWFVKGEGRDGIINSFLKEMRLKLLNVLITSRSLPYRHVYLVTNISMVFRTLFRVVIHILRTLVCQCHFKPHTGPKVVSKIKWFAYFIYIDNDFPFKMFSCNLSEIGFIAW